MMFIKHLEHLLHLSQIIFTLKNRLRPLKTITFSLQENNVGKTIPDNTNDITGKTFAVHIKIESTDPFIAPLFVSYEGFTAHAD